MDWTPQSIGVVVLLKTLKVGSLSSRTDSTYDGADLATWSLVEQNVGVVILNVPAIRPLFSRVQKGSSSKGGDTSGRGYRLDDLGSIGNNNNDIRPDTFQSGVVALSSPRRAKHDLGDLSGSESSLVGKTADGGITKTIGVWVRTYHHGGNEKRALDHPDLV